MKHLRIKILRSSDGKLHYKAVMTQCSLNNVQFGLSKYLSLSEITTILFKNFNNVLTKNYNNNLLLFCDTYSNSRFSFSFRSPPLLPARIPIVFLGKYLITWLVLFSPLSPSPHALVGSWNIFSLHFCFNNKTVICFYIFENITDWGKYWTSDKT